jgi:ATP-dependent Lon protease
MEQQDTEPMVRIPAIGLRKARIDPELLRTHPRLLREGIWAKATLQAESGTVWLTNLKPFQVSDISLQDFIDIRRQFSMVEWMQILISTIGLAPENFTESKKQMILISRLLPLVQGQSFLIEMGPPGTGKTFVLDKLSTRSFVVSGSKISPAQLFYDIKTKTEGLLRQYPALLLDEVDKVQDKELSEEVVNKLLKYMESGTFDRGGMEFVSDTSIIMVGNLPPGGMGNGPILSTMPRKLTHEAFLDRINGIIPGWELSPVMHSSTSLTRTWGFSADYFSEILETLRQFDWIPELRHRLVFANCSIRDEKSIMRTVAGLLKLIHPDKVVPDETLKMVLNYAVEIRQNLLDESGILHRVRPRRLSVSLK